MDDSVNQQAAPVTRPAAASEAKQRLFVCAAIRAADVNVLLGVRRYSTDMYKQIQMATSCSDGLY